MSNSKCKWHLALKKHNKQTNKQTNKKTNKQTKTHKKLSTGNKNKNILGIHMTC